MERKNKPLKGLELISSYFIDKLKNRTNEVGLFEFGIDSVRFDLIMFHFHLMKLRGFEFKINRADFLKDRNSGKWRGYLKYCNTFTWVCPEGLIQKDEVESPAGLLWIGNQKKIGFTTFYIANPQWIKRPKRTEISREIFDKTICLLFGRVKFRKDDFF